MRSVVNIQHTLDQFRPRKCGLLRKLASSSQATKSAYNVGKNAAKTAKGIRIKSRRLTRASDIDEERCSCRFPLSISDRLVAPLLF